MVTGGKYKEGRYFSKAMLRFSATCDGSPKVTSIIDLGQNEIFADPHHALVPAEIFKVHSLTGFEYRALMGKFSNHKDYNGILFNIG